MKRFCPKSLKGPKNREIKATEAFKTPSYDLTQIEVRYIYRNKP